IGIVHQHFMLIDEFTAVENIILGNEIKKNGFLDISTARIKISELQDKYGFNFPLNKKVGELTVGEKQQIEILKILFREANFFIFDEPTAVLTPIEVEGLYKIFRKLKENNNTIVFISHKLKEIFSISDRISVMRNGELIGTFNSDEVTKAGIAVKMVGHEIDITKIEERIPGEILFEMRDVELFLKKKKVLHNINLNIRAGEIVGIAGVEGNGQDELVSSIMSLVKINSGAIFFRDQEISSLSTEDKIKLGFSIIPSDRLKTGAVTEFTLKENVLLGLHNFPEFRRGIFINLEKRDTLIKDIIEKFNVKAESINQEFGNLSGGNQQKIVVGKSIFKNPEIFIAHHPTRGLDISATEFVHSILENLKQNDVGILLISSDLEELLRLSDRIYIMYKGELLEELQGKSVEINSICKLMAGIKD
ncbi:ATP-binding cassette domain-containing protein, partial [Candidatus Dependentiae bacterium]|nr:ATP-binding cassette domain-containing protein [Candidatus Dependentiae bacterium]